MNNLNSDAKKTKILAFSGLFIALALAVDLFAPPDIQIGGVSALRISFGGPFLKLAGLLFGPVIGGIAGVIKDLAGFLIRGSGAYIPLLTVVEFAKGFSIAWLYIRLSKIELKIYSAVYTTIFTVIFLGGALMVMLTLSSPDGALASFFEGVGKRAVLVPYGLVLAGAVGLAAHLFAWMFFAKKKKNTEFFERYMKLFLCVGLPCMIFTTVNTYILRSALLLPDKSILILLIPRLAEEMLTILYNTYLLTVLLSFKKLIKV